MSDFVQTMKDWRRMCRVYTTDDESCCNGCPVVDFREHGCGAVFQMEDSIDWGRYEGAIREWAAEHPEPIYPTWLKWLGEQGILNVTMLPTDTCGGIEIHGTITGKAYEHIPADIAQKLGIEPKEG